MVGKIKTNIMTENMVRRKLFKEVLRNGDKYALAKSAGTTALCCILVI